MTDIHDLVGAYVLDALDPQESAAFEAHLEDCAQCRDELARLSEGAADVADSVAVVPPMRVKEAVMAEVERPTEATVTPIRSRRGPAWVLVGAAAALAVVFAGLWLAAVSQLDSVNQITAVYEASDAAVVEVSTANGPVRFTWSPSLEQGVFNGGQLSELPTSELYQLWIIDPDGPVSAGTLVSGESDVLIEVTEPDVTLAMTVETAPGVDAPTNEPLFAAEL